MIRPIALLLVAALSLTGCASLPVVLGMLGASTGTIAMVQTAQTDLDTALAVDKPLKEMWCRENPPPSLAGRAWCANIPSNAAGLVRQWAAVGLAIELERVTP